MKKLAKVGVVTALVVAALYVGWGIWLQGKLCQNALDRKVAILSIQDLSTRIAAQWDMMEVNRDIAQQCSGLRLFG